MKIWFNKIHDSRRTLVETEDPTIRIGRDPSNTIVLQSPLVSKRQAVVSRESGRLKLENIGINGCMVGEAEVLGGHSAFFKAGDSVRIWPFTLTFESEEVSPISRAELEAHLRSLMADVNQRVHRKLLERLDLYEIESSRVGNPDTIVLLERNIEDVCRELNLFGNENEPLLEEIVGLTLRDLLINQLILESGKENLDSLARLTYNEFDIPATLVPEREAELHNLLVFSRERLDLQHQTDLSGKIRRVESQFAEVFPLVRPHLHRELRKYLILRTLKKELKDTVFGYGPLQDLLRAPTISEIMVVKSDQVYVEL